MQPITLARLRFWATLLSLCGALLLPGSAVWAQSQTFTTNTTINASNKTYEHYNIIVSGCTVTIDGKHSFKSLTIQNNGVVTHDAQSSPNFANGMNLTITGNCAINTGSSINVVGMGWAGGSGTQPAGGAGAGVSDSIGGGGGGGSYGGEGLAGTGGAGGTTYGETASKQDSSTLKTPTDIGSGGGSGNQGSNAGGAGGGAIQMTVNGILTLDGSIVADGVSGTTADTNSNSGGGSGGAIYLIVNTLTHTSGLNGGLISANGGANSIYSTAAGSGGGGRIAIYYTTISFETQLTSTYRIRAQGGIGGGYTGGNGTPTYIGGAGTVFMRQTGQKQGDLWVHNCGKVENGGTPFHDLQIFDNIYVWGQGVLTAQPVNQVGIPTDPQLGHLELTVLSNVTVAVTGRISVTGRGYLGGYGAYDASGPGAGTSDTTGSNPGGGGSYGGEGLTGYGNTRYNAGGAPYDDVLLRAPSDLGSGGGGGGQGVNLGGSGGGAIQMTVDGVLQIDGQIQADGNGSSYSSNGTSGGGGSGGSIYLIVKTLGAGGGSITANGGTGYGYPGGNGYPAGGAGGGGRIAIDYTNNSFETYLTSSYRIQATGGSNNYGNYAGAGTVLLQSLTQKYGDLWVHNSGNVESAATPLQEVDSTTFTFDDVYIWGDGVLSAPPGSPLTLTVLGTLDVANNGALSVNIRGYGGGYGTRAAGGPGAGVSDTTGNDGGGGGYGGAGNGGNSNINMGGAAYGSATQPTTLGSGGGSGDKGVAAGGNGGGAIDVIINGTLQVDGVISADGNSGASVYIGSGEIGPGDYADGGGGSGGSILLVTNTLSGAGTISAAGGSGGYGGGGGGGRIAVYAATNSFTGTLRAPLGSGGANGGAGTVNTYSVSGVNINTLVINPATIAEGQKAVGTVTLSGVAPKGGITLSLTSSNPSAATVPLTVTVLQGKKSATFTITAKAIGTADSTTISATLGGITQSATLNVMPWIAGVTLNPAAVAAGTATIGTVTLNFPAPQGGLPVSLASDTTGAATVPSGVTVKQGQTSATFNITTSSSTTTETSVTITATYGHETDTATLSIDPSNVALKAFVLSPGTVVGGNISIGIVSLTGNAPAGGAVVALSSANPAIASIQTTYVTIQPGESSAAFVISTPQVTSSQTVSLTAALGSATQPATLTSTLTVTPTGVATLTLVPNSLMGGMESSVGIVTLQSAVSTDTTVTISSNNPLAIPDFTSIVIPAGATVGTINIETTANTTGSPISAIITATANGIGQSATLTIN